MILKGYCIKACGHIDNCLSWLCKNCYIKKEIAYAKYNVSCASYRNGGKYYNNGFFIINSVLFLRKNGYTYNQIQEIYNNKFDE